MRYLINRKTNEHQRYDGQNYDATKYRIVEADSEGWIAWDCEADLECPISEDQPYHARLRSGSIVDGVVRWDCYNNHGDVLAYRPILTEKVQEPEPIPASTAAQRRGRSDD